MEDDTTRSHEAGEAHVFTVAEARALMPEVRSNAADLVSLRADMAELAAEVRGVGGSALGGVAELKAMEARFSELQTWFTDKGIEVKGIAPLLIDFPASLDGVSVRLCWLEDETELGWYHRSDLGFLGRRPLPPEAS
ncbi:hypothetical protein FHX37_2221 [Haloactinospora alba]|uniref:DUF2203 family protein n=1 Tax=Haloactinospora alba TaxID=405555 RepID=A0A543NK80_9ACTN|nr:DUF2203 domain-containing protein [Haloactinospora alba]TQN32271.1 hypothetical protein FHX37_2221 [Haloactinospora alba]